jgi:carbon-monoxide dehydrogenase small subunit
VRVSTDELYDVRLTVNGQVVERCVEGRRSLADFLRRDLSLRGTHIGCEHGVCGACTVLVDGRSARSCLLFAVQLDGRAVTTIEGLTPAHGLSPLQAAFRQTFALQCGFCTPGMIVASHELLADNPSPSEAEIREALAGNLCMCTGYVTIIGAVLKAANAFPQRGPFGETVAGRNDTMSPVETALERPSLARDDNVAPEGTFAEGGLP